MDPTPPKRLKSDDNEDTNAGGVPATYRDDNCSDVEYEMLIDEDPEGISGGTDARDESTTSSSDSSGVKTDRSEEDVKPAKLFFNVKQEPESDEGSHHDEDDVKISFPLLPKCPRFLNASGKQFIVVEAPILFRVRQLRCSALLNHAGMDICLHNLGCLMLIDDRFIAKLEPIDVQELRRASGFEQAKGILLRQLRIVRIVQDDATGDRDRYRTAIVNRIRLSDAADAAQILEIVQKSSDLRFVELCEKLLDDRIISRDLKEQAENLLRIEQEIDRRNEFLKHFTDELRDDVQDLNATLKQFCKSVILKRLKFFLESTPSFLRDHLKDVAEGGIFRIHDDDVKAFCDIEKSLTMEIFRKPLEDLAKRWINRVNALQNRIPLVSSTFISLLRSLEELILKIVEGSDHTPEELLQTDQRGWHRLEAAISWRSESSLTSCLQQEYNFVFRMLNHFDPAAETVEPFDYQANRPFKAIPNEHFAWFCLLDNVLEDLDLGPFQQIVMNFLELVKKSTSDQVEKIRIMTHSMCRFIAQTLPLMNSVQSAEEDEQVIQAQLDVVNRAMLGNANAFRNLLDELTCFWNNRLDIIEAIPKRNALPAMGLLKQSLLSIAIESLRKQVEINLVITWFRIYNNFLTALADVSFVWLVKSLPDKPRNAAIALEYIEPVENETYRVVEPIKFHQLFTVLLVGTSCPRHYAIDVVGTLLECVRTQLGRGSWSDADQLAAAGVLIALIQGSLAYLHEQTEYVSFEQFLEDSTRPFCSLIEQSGTLKDFTGRAGMIADSFGKLRRPAEICLDEALRMFDELNDDFNVSRLKRTYQQYLNTFEKYVMEAVRVPIKPTPFEDWSPNFKCSELPKIVAAVAAAWFKQSSTKATCVQILAVLRLLDVDTYESGIGKHLVQILQGKSLVIALVAATLALNGHRILVACLNADRRRYAMDYAGLFEDLGVTEAIKFGSYDDMVDAIISPPQIDGKTVELQNLVSDLILSGKPPPLKVQSAPILLVDEVDVFFDKEYYGNAFCLGAFPCVPGLDQIQQKIWNLINDLGLRDTSAVSTQIEQLISSQMFSGKEDFQKFLDHPTPYDLIIFDGIKHVQKQFTNRTLFHEELKPMIENAISVATNPSEHADYRLNAQGAITYRDGDRFVTWSVPGYKSVFNYFRLKQANFNLKVSCTPNYGYLNVSCGLFSYALLPTEFPLILAVTKNPPNQHLKRILERLYDINRTSTFETSPKIQFTHLPTKLLWMEKIFDQAKANRPAIVVFSTSTQLDEFRTHYGQSDDVTLVTRNDFKLPCGGNAHAHVIWTFFPVEEKMRETKSYELIVFDGHLEEELQLIGAGRFGGTYAELMEARAALVAKEREGMAEKVEESEADHRTTMRYLRSFFE